MTDEKQDEERANRDRDRSAEAHWQVAEAAAEEEEKRLSEEEEKRLSEAARQSGERQKEWENEGGALGRDP